MPDSPPALLSAAAFAEGMPARLLTPAPLAAAPGVEILPYEIPSRFEGTLPPAKSVIVAQVAHVPLSRYAMRQDGGGLVADRRIGGGGLTLVGPGRAMDIEWASDSITDPRQALSTHVHLDPARLTRAAAEADLDPARVTLRDDVLYEPDPLVLGAVEALHAAATSADATAALYAETLTAALTAHLLRRYCEHDLAVPEHRGGLTARQLARVRDLAQVRLGEPLALADLAGAAGLSEYHFSREYKRSTGEAPFEMVRRLRMEEAARLLRETALGALAVGVAVGYGSAAAFSTAFRRHHGLTPTAYRRHAR